MTMDQPAPVVFVVDDDRVVQESTCALIETLGVEARGFDTAQAFLNDLPAKPVGCAVIDYLMPGMNGMELIRELRSRSVDMPVILFTGQGDLERFDAAAELNVFRSFYKPFVISEFLEALQTALAADRGRASP